MEERRLTDDEYRMTAQHLDLLVQQFEQLPIPEIQERVFELLRTVDALHREGLHRLVDYLQEHGQAESVDRAARDPAVHTLFLLYDLVPGDPILQAERALDSVRPYIASHGGEVELLDVVDGVVHLRLSGSCHGCAGSAVTLKRGIEAALREGLPGFSGIQVHEPPVEVGRTSPDGLITFDQVQPAVAGSSAPHRRETVLNAPVFKTVARLGALPPGTVLPVAAENRNALLVNLQGEVFAVGAECPGSDFPLTFGQLNGPELTCPWHNEVFDVRSGKCLDAAGREDAPRLPVYPVAVAGGEIQIAVNVAPRPPIQAGRDKRSG